MKRDEALSKAAEYINGPRAEDYGKAFDNFERIAEGWNIILRNALATHGYFTPAHVALMMDWVKTSRLLNNLDSDDGWVDKIGYAALGVECVHISKEHSEVFDKILGDRT